MIRPTSLLIKNVKFRLLLIVVSLSVFVLLPMKSYIRIVNSIEQNTITELTSSPKTVTKSKLDIDQRNWKDIGWVRDNNGKRLCQFKLSGNEPLPVLLISLGRSGSSITWDTIATLTGQLNKAWEYTGK